MPQKFLSNGVLLALLRQASQEERLAMTRIFDHSAIEGRSAELLQEQIGRTGGHGLANWLRGQGTGYIDILDDVVSALKVHGLPEYMGARKLSGLSLWQLDEQSIIKTEKRDVDHCRELGIEYVELAEGKVLLKLLEAAYESMSTEQRQVVDARVREVASQFGGNPSKNLAGSAGLLLVGNLGGFATYTLMSTVLSTVSLGTLGFGAYTAVSSALSVALGPVGWTALGAAGVYAYGKPQLKKTIPIVANVAMIRQRLGARRLN